MAKATRTILPGGVEVTARERQVLELLVEGATNPEIAKRLGFASKPSKTTCRCFFAFAEAQAAAIRGRLADDAEPIGRVRSSDPTIGTLMRDAAERSRTFRELVSTIEATDGLVYVEAGACRHNLQACLVAVTVSGPHLHYQSAGRRFGALETDAAIETGNAVRAELKREPGP